MLLMVQRKTDGYHLIGKGAVPDAATVDKVRTPLPVRCSIKDGWMSLRVTIFSFKYK